MKSSKSRIPFVAMVAVAAAGASAGSAQTPFDVVVEIPAGSAVKYEYDACARRMRVDRFVQMPVAYPANYGFIPGTLAGDGDPLDFLLFTREPLVPGAIVAARAIGVLRMVDGGEADEKVIAVPATGLDPAYDPVASLEDLGSAHVARLEQFFQVYKRLPEEESGAVVLHGFGDAAEAERMVQSARRSAEERAGDDEDCRAERG